MHPPTIKSIPHVSQKKESKKAKVSSNHCFVCFLFFVLFIRDVPFFSMTVTRDEVSLIVDDDLISGFESGSPLQVHPSEWRCVQVDFGSMGFSKSFPPIASLLHYFLLFYEQQQQFPLPSMLSLIYILKKQKYTTASMGVVSLLADILAKEGISIYYLSTFGTDFVLVRCPPISSHFLPFPPISSHFLPFPPISSHFLPFPPISSSYSYIFINIRLRMHRWRTQ